MGFLAQLRCLRLLDRRRFRYVRQRGGIDRLTCSIVAVSPFDHGFLLDSAHHVNVLWRHYERTVPQLFGQPVLRALVVPQFRERELVIIQRSAQDAQLFWRW